MSFLFAVLGLLGLVYYFKTLFDTIEELKMDETVEVEIAEGLENLKQAVINALGTALKDGVDMDIAVQAIKDEIKKCIPDIDMNKIVDDVYLEWYDSIKGGDNEICENAYRYINADKILFIDGVDSTLADLNKPAYFLLLVEAGRRHIYSSQIILQQKNKLNWTWQCW